MVATVGPISALIWPLDSPQPLFYVRGPTGLLTDAAWAPDSEHLAATSLDGTVGVYDCVVCRPLSRLESLAQARLAVAR